MCMDDGEYFSDEEYTSRLHVIDARARDIENQRFHCMSQALHLSIDVNGNGWISWLLNFWCNLYGHSVFCVIHSYFLLLAWLLCYCAYQHLIVVKSFYMNNDSVDRTKS